MYYLDVSLNYIYFFFSGCCLIRMKTSAISANSLFLLILLIAFIVFYCSCTFQNESYSSEYGATHTKWYQDFPLPDSFSSKRVACTDGCMYRPRNASVAVDHACLNMCMNTENGQYTNAEFNRYMNELTGSINRKAIVYDHQ